jgi:hypothetical protein
MEIISLMVDKEIPFVTIRVVAYVITPIGTITNSG